MSIFNGETVKVVLTDNGVAELILDRPDKLNAMNPTFFAEMRKAAEAIEESPEVGVVLVHGGEARGFTAGLDLMASAGSISGGGGMTAEKSAKFLRMVEQWQQAFSRLHSMRKPTIAAVHGCCIGGGMDLISSCDIRLGSAESYYSIREVKVGIVADVGTLQRIQKTMSLSAAREMCYTGNNYSAKEMYEWGFLSRVYKDKHELLKNARKLANEIGSNSQLVVGGTKDVLNYSLEHTAAEGLRYVALWNAAFLESADLHEAMAAYFEKRKPKYTSKL